MNMGILDQIDFVKRYPNVPSVGATLPLLLLLLLAAVAIDYLQLLRKRRALQGIPIVGEGSYWQRRLSRPPIARDFKGVLQHGLDTYTSEGEPWAIPFGRDYMVVLSPKALKDYDSKTPEHFSFVDTLNRELGLQYTCPMLRDHVKAVQVSVSKRQNLSPMHEAIVAAIDQELGAVVAQEKDQVGAVVEQEKDLDWHPFVAYEVIWTMMIKVATAYIIGPEFAQDSEYIRHCVDFCCQQSEFGGSRLRFPESIEPLLGSLSRCGRALNATITQAKRQLVPEIRQRMERALNGSLPDGFRHTLLDAGIQIKLKAGGIDRDTALGDEVISTLAGDCLLSALETAFPIAAYTIGMMDYAIADPGYAGVLRKEITAAIDAAGGEWPIDILDQMPRLESFARETVRCDTTSIFTGTRRLQKPVRLDSIGRTLDRGTFVALPAEWQHQNPATYHDPERFDGCRFYDETANRCYPRVATGAPDFLPFGYGAEMCPGRDLGMRQARLAFAKILIAFDLDSYPVRGVKTPNKASSPVAGINRDFKLQWRRRRTG